MFLIIGLNRENQMVLHDDTFKEPTEEEIRGTFEEWNYQQILIVDKGDTCASQIARYEFKSEPQLKKLPLIM